MGSKAPAAGEKKLDLPTDAEIRGKR